MLEDRHSEHRPSGNTSARRGTQQRSSQTLSENDELIEPPRLAIRNQNSVENPNATFSGQNEIFQRPIDTEASSPHPAIPRRSPTEPASSVASGANDIALQPINTPAADGALSEGRQSGDRRQFDEVRVRYGNMWYLSGQSPWEHSFFLKLLLLLWVTSTFGLILFALSLEGILLAAVFDPFFFLMVVGGTSFYIEGAIIMVSVRDGISVVRKERRKERQRETQEEA